MSKIITCEQVSNGHPDKICDQIADAIVTDILQHDRNARVAIECLLKKSQLFIAGEVTTDYRPNYNQIVHNVFNLVGAEKLGWNLTELLRVGILVDKQSSDIALGVDKGGAGDQGIMYGYACWETVELLPAPVVLANRITSLLTTCREEKLISGIGPDGKAQVSVQYAFGVPERVDTIVISCQHDADKDPDELREELRRLVIARACHDVRIDEQTKIFINPSGRFVLGGFDADTGLTGRKLMVDTYGGLTLHGGGALSGKDGTKVDRSGAYMARYVAKNVVAAGLADVCTVNLAYAIGQTEPVAVEIDTQESGYYDDAFLTEAVRRVFDFTPAGMIRALDLDKPFFAEVCNNCHFMHPQAAWEQMDKAEKLRMACAELEDERT